MAITDSTNRYCLSFSQEPRATFVWSVFAWRRTLALWDRRRRYRKDLKRLLRVGPHMIADIGLTFEGARREIEKPFWRA